MGALSVLHFNDDLTKQSHNAELIKIIINIVKAIKSN